LQHAKGRSRQPLDLRRVRVDAGLRVTGTRNIADRQSDDRQQQKLLFRHSNRLRSESTTLTV
jgi:hypothetical protein